MEEKLAWESIPFFWLLVFLRMKQEQIKTGASHAKEKHERLDRAMCLWAKYNSNGSLIFSDFKSDLSRIARFPSLARANERVHVHNDSLLTGSQRAPYSTCARDVIKFSNPKLMIRGTKFISVYNFPAQWRPSFGNQRILNFQVMAVRDIKLRSRLSKKIYLSRDF